MKVKRVAAAFAAALVVSGSMASVALADREEEESAGGESAEVTQAINSFMAPRQAPAEGIAPGAFPAARQYAAGVAAVDATRWQELGPYSYYPHDRRYLSQPFSNSGSGSGYNTRRITGAAVTPAGPAYAGGGRGGGGES